MPRLRASTARAKRIGVVRTRLEVALLNVALHRTLHETYFIIGNGGMARVRHERFRVVCVAAPPSALPEALSRRSAYTGTHRSSAHGARRRKTASLPKRSGPPVEEIRVAHTVPAASVGGRTCSEPIAVALIVGIVEEDRCADVAALDHVEAAARARSSGLFAMGTVARDGGPTRRRSGLL
jgi:hypothetical protein